MIIFKHRPNIILETLFRYDCLQKSNTFVIFVTQGFPWSVRPIRGSFDSFAKVIRSPIFTNPYFGVYPLKPQN